MESVRVYYKHMLFVSILHHYILWHYTKALGEILHVWKNFFWFVFHFFSIPQLSRSLFSPWKRMTETRSKTFNLEDFAGYIIINLFSRIIGLILRSFIILIGVFCLFILCMGIITTYIFWFFAPAILLICMIYGLVLIF